MQKEIVVDGVTFIPKSEQGNYAPAQTLKGLKINDCPYWRKYKSL